jgi:hypothetical protein
MTDHQPEPRRLGCLGAAVLLVIGALLLLPGLCSALFAVSAPWWVNTNTDARGFLILLALWTVGILIGAMGVRLITMAIRALSQRRT